MANGRKTYSGVVHVHTDRSGGAPFEEILRAAKDSRADFVVVTDCGVPLAEAKAREGWHDGVLVLAGEEICGPDGHFLVFGASSGIEPGAPYDETVRQVRAHSGAAVGVHYHYDGMTRPPTVPAPLPMSRVDIAELWSFHDEFVSRAKGKMAVQFHGRPERLLVGPESKVLREWDEVQAARSLPAVGSATALCRKEPLLDWKEYFPFSVSFKTIRTMIQCEELPGDSAEACRIVWSALLRGTSYLANVSLGSADEFDFCYVDGAGNEFRMGDSTTWDPKGRVRLHLAEPAESIFRLNSHPLLWVTGNDIDFPAPAPGVYRIEVRQDRRTWILSNAIRVVREPEREKDGPVRPSTVMELT